MPHASSSGETASNVVRDNLQLLQRAGVTLLIGSDHAETSLAEAQHLRTFAPVRQSHVAKMWCEATPAAIFPERRIAKFAEGYEASFSRPGRNPIEDFDQVRAIRRRFKQGCRSTALPCGRCLVSSGPEESVMRDVQPALRQHSGNWSGQKLECTMERNGWRGLWRAVWQPGHDGAPPLVRCWRLRIAKSTKSRSWRWSRWKSAANVSRMSRT